MGKSTIRALRQKPKSSARLDNTKTSSQLQSENASPGQKDGSAGKGVCSQKFHRQGPHDPKGGPDFCSCPLTSMHTSQPHIISKCKTKFKSHKNENRTKANQCYPASKLAGIAMVIEKNKPPAQYLGKKKRLSKKTTTDRQLDIFFFSCFQMNQNQTHTHITPQLPSFCMMNQ